MEGNRLRRILLPAVPSLLLVALLLAVETTVRLRLPAVPTLDFLVTADPQQAQFVDQRHVRICEGDPLLFWRLAPNLDRVLWDLTVVSTNDQGLRYPGHLGPRAPGSLRILCLGDSVTFGYRTPRVLPRDPEAYDPGWLPYPLLVEQALRAANPGRVIEVVPMAVPGYSSHQGLAWLRRDIDGMKPDVVTACFGWNDIGLRAASDASVMTTDWLSTTARGLVCQSQALLRLARWLRERRRDRSMSAPREARAIPRVSRREYVANLLAIARLARAQGVAAVFIAPVYRDRIAHPPEGEVIAGYRDDLRAAAGQEGIPFLEVPELTESSYPANDGLFEEHIHPNHKGQRLLAERLRAFLAGHGLLHGLAPGPPPREHAARASG